MSTHLRILIIGGTGFIGTRVTRALRGHAVTLFHRGLTCAIGPDQHLHGDRADLALFRDRIGQLRPDVVLDMRPQNAADARHVLDGITGLSNRVVAISSGSVYRSFGILMGVEGGGLEPVPVREDGARRERLFPYRGSAPRSPDDPRRWLDDYDKIPAEEVFMTHPGVDCNIVRLPMVYGPHDGDARDAAYLRRMADRRPVILLQAGVAAWRNARAYVDNAADAIARVVVAGAPGRVYNVAEPDDFTEAEWIQRIGEQAGWTGTIRIVPDGSPVGRPGFDEFSPHANFAQHLRMDTSRIRRELHYRETVRSTDALRLTVEAAMDALPAVDYAEEDRFLAGSGF